MTTTMQAAYRTTYGTAEVLTVREVDQPIPTDDEVLVKVHAATVNRTDCGFLTGKPYIARLFTGLFGPNPKIPGTDFAGTVEAVGKKVSRFQVGDRVFGMHDFAASHAQYLAFRADRCIEKMPGGLSFDKAAASLEGAHYAWSDIKVLNLRPGDKVLVNGATGAIGSAAVQILRNLDIEVTAVANTKNMALVRSLGAKRVLNYETEDFTQLDEQFAFVFDAVGKSTFGKCKHLLRPKGVYISTELGPGWQNPLLALLTPLVRGRRVLFPLPLDQKGSMVFIKKMLEEGKFDPVMDRTYPLGEIRKAYEYVASGEKTGNVMVHP